LTDLAAVAPSPAPPPVVAHVAVFEDDRTNQRLVQRMLQRIGCSCDLFEDGDMAVAAMEATGQLQSEGSSPLRAPEQHSRASSLVNKPYDFVLMVRLTAAASSRRPVI
jgi:CheY-like chemotaxis protein